jgi:hypothetical protein
MFYFKLKHKRILKSITYAEGIIYHTFSEVAAQ